MKSILMSVASACFSAALAGQANAAVATGKIIITQGHEAPSCRMVALKETGTGSVLWFRILNTGSEDGILAVTLTTLTTD